MRFLLISTIALLGMQVAVADNPPKKAEHPTTAIENKTVQQRFNPIFGSEKQANEIISFIASNLVVELNVDQVKNIDGFMIASFTIDTSGNIDRIDVYKSIRPWIDYAIISGLKRLPAWGKPTTRPNGKVYESQHSIVFSFGSYVKGDQLYGYQKDLVRNQTQQAINKQRNEYFGKIADHYTKWDVFAKKNSRLEYDTKNGLTNHAPIILPQDPTTTPSGLPSGSPTITIRGKE